jgi:Flp pilus assembly pilin Flp
LRPIVAAASTSLRSARTTRGERPSGSGQGLVEYGLILMVMAVVCVVSLVFFGDQLSSLLSLIASAV